MRQDYGPRVFSLPALVGVLLSSQAWGLTLESAYPAAARLAGSVAEELAAEAEGPGLEAQEAPTTPKASMTLEQARKLIPGRYFECRAKGKSSTLDPRDHRAVADLREGRILLLLDGGTREFALSVIDFSPLPENKGYVRFGGQERGTGAMITVGARDLKLEAGKSSKQGGVLLSTTNDNVTLTVGGPASCKIIRE